MSAVDHATTVCVEVGLREQSTQLLIAQHRLRNSQRSAMLDELVNLFRTTPLLQSLSYSAEYEWRGAERYRLSLVKVTFRSSDNPTALLSGAYGLEQCVDGSDTAECEDQFIEYLESRSILQRWAQALDCGQSTVRFEVTDWLLRQLGPQFRMARARAIESIFKG